MSDENQNREQEHENKNLETEQKSIDNMTPDEVKAEAEKLEAENKTLKESAKDEVIASDQKVRLEKARASNQELRGEKVEEKKPEKTETPTELSADNVYTLRDKGLLQDSDEAKVLAEYAAMPRNTGKSYAELMDTPGVQAEFEAITSSKNAKAVIGEGAEEEQNLTTKKDVENRYKTTGEVPEDKAQVKDLAKSNLDRMGI